MELEKNPKVGVDSRTDNTEEKVSVKRVKSYRVRESVSYNDDYRKRFYLWGIVQKVARNGEAVLVSRGNTQTTFWMDIDPTKQTVKEGDKCRFEITISSFISRDGTVKTNLRVVEALILASDDEDALENGFNEGYGILDVEIMGSTRTDKPGLFLLSMRRVDESGNLKERYYMRYYSIDGLHPDLGAARVLFTLGKVREQLTDKGKIFSVNETRKYEDEKGDIVTKQSIMYVPALQATSIER